MKTEKDLQIFTRDLCKRHGVLCYKFASPARRGVPDLILIGANGAILFVELKSPAKTGTVSALQKREIRILKEQGCVVYVVDCPRKIEEIVRKICA